MNLTEWARLPGIQPQAAYRRFREGTPPVPAVRVNSRPVLVAPGAVTASAQGGIGRYARVSSHDQRADLARLTGRAAQCGGAVVRAEAEAGSEMNGHAQRPGGCPPVRACRRWRPGTGAGPGG